MFATLSKKRDAEVRCARSRRSLAILALPSLTLIACTGRIESSSLTESAPGGQAVPGKTGDGAGTAPGGTPGTAPGSGAAPGAPGTPGAPATSLGQAVLRRLTSTQYRNAIEDLLGTAAAAGLQVKLEDDARLNGLTAIGASVTSPSPRATELHEQAADQIVTAALADGARRMALVGCDPGQAACLDTFVARFGRRAWRRPLDQAEVARYVAVAKLGAGKAGDVWVGLRFALIGLLSSPHFLYRVELGVPDPTDGKRRVLGPFELASRLAFFLTNRPPDEMLLEAAAANKLSRPEELHTHAKRLLSSPGAAAALESFYDDYLDLGALAALSKDAAFTDAVKAAMRTETLRTLRTLTFDEDQDFRQVLTTRTTFLTPELARHYGMPAASGSAPVRAEYPAERAGLLMHGSLLALNAHNTTTSPTKRGKFVRETFLCQSVPDPPPDVDTSLPEGSGGMTTARKRLEAHRENPVCASCHTVTDPIGLALENFDATGRYRTMENGQPIDPSGELDGVPFKDAPGLAQAIANHDQVGHCFATTLLRQAAGDLLTAPETGLAQGLEERFARARFSVRALLLDLVSQPAFNYVRPSEGG